MEDISASLIGIRSVRTASPEPVRNLVSKTFEFPAYLRSASYSPVGEIFQYPPRSRSNMAANIEGESKRGQHSHSMQPNFDTSAAVLQSPITPYSSIPGKYPQPR